MKFLINQYNKRFQIIFETSWTLVSQLILTGLNTLLVFSLANLLDPHDFGQFKFVTTWGTLAFGLGYTGYTYIVTQKFARNEPVFLGVLYKKTIQKSWYIFLILLGASIYYYTKDNFLLSLGFLLTIFTTITTLLTPLASGFYIGKKRIIFNTNIILAVTIFQVFSVLLVSYLAKNIFLTLTFYLLTTSIGYGLSIIYAYRKNKSEIGIKNISESEEKYEEQSASTLNITSIVSSFAYNLDKLLLFHFVGAIQLAVYSIVLAISDQLRTPFKALSGILLPRLALNQDSKNKALIVFFIITIISSLITIIFFFINPYIFRYIFPKYIDYIFISNLSLLILPLSGGGILSTYLQSQKDYKTLNNNIIIMTSSMIVLYTISSFFKSLEMFIISRNLTALICFVYILYRFYKIK